MKRLLFIALVLISMLAMQSCATLLAGSSSHVKVSGTPDSARVYMNGNYVGVAPVRVKVPRGKNKNITIVIKKENYKPSQVPMSSKLSTGYLLLDLISGGVPVIIDFVTGDIYAPYPKKINYNLEPKK